MFSVYYSHCGAICPNQLLFGSLVNFSFVFLVFFRHNVVF